MNTMTFSVIAVRLTQILSICLGLMISSLSTSLYAFDPVNDDTDIFLANPNIPANRPNVLVILDNTANWSRNVDGQAININELSALSNVVQNLGEEFNIGVMMFPETGAGNDSVDGGYLRYGIRQMKTANRNALVNIVNALDGNDDKGNNNTASLAMMEAYRYFSGKANRATHGKDKSDYDGNAPTSTTTPFESALGDYPLGTTPSASTNYVSPINDQCQDSFIIYISNGDSSENASALAISETELSSLGYDTANPISVTPNGRQGNWFDEWASYMANADMNGATAGTPHVYTYVVEVDPQTSGNNDDWTAVLKSAALNGRGAYFSVSSANSGQGITNALNSIFNEIQAVNSVFAATTLPVSVNVRGTNLNQVYIGVFRPDAQKQPRWFGNLKMYKLGFDDTTSTLFLADASGSPAENATTGFIDPSAASFQTFSSSFWNFRGVDENGTGGSSDLPDGDLVEKGGIAQGLRTDYAASQATRKLYTCTSGTTICTTGSSLSATPFSTANDGITNAGLGLGSTAISTLTGFESKTITDLTDTKTVTSLNTTDPAIGTVINTLTAVPNGEKVITSITNTTSQNIGTMTNGASSQSISALTRGTGGCKSIVTATINGHGYSTGQVVHITGVGSTEYNGTYTITVLDTNRFTYNSGNCNPANNPVITSAQSTTTTSIVTVTVTGHGYSDGQLVTIENVTPSEHNVTNKAITYIDANKFSYTTASALSPITDVSTATVTVASNTATATSTAHGFSVGDTVKITGASPSGYNTSFKILTTPTINTFTFNTPSPLGNASKAGTPDIKGHTTSTVTATAGAAHGFIATNDIVISNGNPAGYNGLFTVTGISGTGGAEEVFTYNTTIPVDTNTGTGMTATLSTFNAVAYATISNHGFGAVGDGINITIAGVTGVTGGTEGDKDSYNGNFSAEVVDASTIKYTVNDSVGGGVVPDNPGPATSTGTITARFNAGATSATAIATVASHGYSTGDTIIIAGATSTDYNGTFTITKTSDDTFIYTKTGITPPLNAATGALTATDETTTAKARVVNHGFANGASVAIAGATPSAFNGNKTITLVDTDNFTYTLASPQGDASGSMTASSGTGSTGERADLINWVRGTDNNEDENLNSDSTDVRSSIHSDVLHSRPAVINYNRHGNDDDVYVFYGSNDGVFRAIKGGFNQSDVSEPLPFDEAWGFVMEEHFSQLERLRNNEPTISSSNKKPYFADGSIGVYTKDANSDGKIVATDGDKVWLFISMHRGGRFIYALDVSDPSDPKLLWKKSNIDWPELGQTWSVPLVKELAIDTDGAAAGDDDDNEVVLIFGAGYDPTVEDVDPELITSFNADADTDNNLEVVAGAASYERSMGRGIFVVDAQTGNPLWQAGPAVSNPGASHTFLTVTGMNYAIPSDVVVIPDRNSTTSNRAYVGDTGGNMWRVDMDDSSVANWTVTKIASVADHSTTGSATDDDGNTITIIPGLRKFLFPPDIVYSEDGYDAVLIGSGDREHPFDTGVINRFYMFKDSSTGATVDAGFTTFAESDLFDATSNCAQAATACSNSGDELDQNAALNALTTKKGWYITLVAGEKVVGNAVTLNNVTFFNTNVPSSVAGSGSCESNLGEARQYQIQFSDATAIADQNIDGSTNAADRYSVHAGGGYLPSPVPVVVEINGEIHQGVISGVSVEQPPGTTLNTRLRKFWYKEME